MKTSKEHREILTKAAALAKANGFAISDSFFTEIGAEDYLFNGMQNYYNIIFDHQFAKHLWPEGVYMELMLNEGSEDEHPREVDLVETLKEGNHPMAGLAMTEENLRIPMWQYNLSQMALSEDPLMYIKKTLLEEGDDEA